MPRATWRPAIPADQRPQLIDRVRELNAQGMYDVEIAPRIGYSTDTVSALRREGGIPAVPGTRNSRACSEPAGERFCPTCLMPIDVRDGVIEDHRGYLGRIVRMVAVVDDCPMSGQPYHECVDTGLVAA